MYTKREVFELYNILVCDDDKEIVDSIDIYLRNEGINVIKAYDGLEALEALMENDVYLILMDIMMPNMDGLRTTMKIRKEKNIPIILISAKSEDTDKILGLNMGADDYISKPFCPRELVSRIGVVLRRSGKASAVLESGGITIDTGKAVVKRDGNEIFLSALEYRILLILFQNKGMILSREKLLEAIWDVAGDFVNDNTLTVYIKRLREKIEKEPAKPEIIKTIRGMGYGVF